MGEREEEEEPAGLHPVGHHVGGVDRPGHRQVVVVGLDHGLLRAGGPRRVGVGGGLVGRRRLTPTDHLRAHLLELGGAADLEVGEALPVVRWLDPRRIDDDHVLERDLLGLVLLVEEDEAVAHRPDLGELGRIVDDHQLDRGVGVGVADLLGVQRGVDRDRLETDREAGEVAGQPLFAGLAEEADDVVVGQLDGCEDAGGDGVGTVCDLFPGPVGPLGAVLDPYCDVIWTLLRALV